jgi:ribosomal protein S18 acetylase RimI-like enzyme
MRDLFSRFSPAGRMPNIQTILPGEIDRVSLSLFSQFSPATLREHVLENPGDSFVDVRTGHYIVAGSWRRRDEIGCIYEFSPGRIGLDLVQTVVDRMSARGVRLLLSECSADGRDRETFRQTGFQKIDEIVELAKTGMAHAVEAKAYPIREFRAIDRDEVLEIERVSFPWLWWNSTAELEHYSSSDAVRLFVMPEEDRLVGYVGLTKRGDHAHLDRLAVRADDQRAGRGAALVAHALSIASEMGVRTITLTTQRDNVQSRRLYERFGFRTTHRRYRFDGLWLA